MSESDTLCCMQAFQLVEGSCSNFFDSALPHGSKPLSSASRQPKRRGFGFFPTPTPLNPPPVHSSLPPSPPHLLPNLNSPRDHAVRCSWSQDRFAGGSSSQRESPVPTFKARTTQSERIGGLRSGAVEALCLLSLRLSSDGNSIACIADGVGMVGLGCWETWRLM